MSHLPVLIVGAGPTGLMMACELERHGIPFRIIDKKSEPTQGSNATWIQARTLEIFDTLGIVDCFLKRGHKCETINFYIKGKVSATISLAQIDSTYPFVLMLPQSETEQLLNDRLKESKICVERSLELVNIKQTNHGIMSTIRLSNGDTEDFTSDWLIACDGANSTVREKSSIPFPGEDFPEQFMVADAKMSSFLSTNEIHAFVDKGTIFPERGTLFSAFPWGLNDYRLSANLYLENPRQTFTEQEVREVVAERTYGNYIVKSVSWISPFWIHSKIVDQMQHGSIFLAGDAAHIHSPAGGQGMNTGMQDAFNLAWKLALVIKRKANVSLLKSYQSERFPIVKKVVDQTDYYTNMVLFNKSFFNQLKKLNHEILAHPHLSKKIGEQLTQLDIHYKKSPVINYEGKPNAKSPLQGERAPNVRINDSKKLYEYLSNTLHNILLFTGNNPSEDELDKIIELQNLIKNHFSDLVKTFVITNKHLEKVNNIIMDSIDSICHRYKVSKYCIFIIRPDHYIAYYSTGIDLASIETFLQNYLSIT